MEIKRIIHGEEVSIVLSDAEALEVYREKKKELDYQEIKDTLLDYEEVGYILELCGFSEHYLSTFSDDQLEQAENLIAENENVLRSIFERKIEEEEKYPYRDALDLACEEVLQEWGKEYPNYMKQFETVQQKAYARYKSDWIERQNYSEEFLNGIRKDYEEEYKEFGVPSSFEEYIDVYGFGGELYVCFNEFLDNEYQERGYMEKLLTKEEFKEYLLDVDEKPSVDTLIQSAKNEQTHINEGVHSNKEYER